MNQGVAVAANHLGVDLIVLELVIADADVRPVRVDQHHTATQGQHFRMPPHEFDLHFEPPWQADVIRIHPRDKLAGRNVQSIVQCPDDPRIRPGDHANTLVPLRELREDRRRAVGRPVIDNDELEIPERLRKDTLHRLRDIRGGVVSRHHN